MRIKKTSDTSISKVNSILFAASGWGKTTSARTLPEDKTLIVYRDLQQSAAPLRHMNFPLIEPESWEDIQAIYAGLESGEIDGVDCDKIKIVFVDSLMGISELCMQQILRKDRPDLYRSRGKSEKPKGIYEEQMTMEDYGIYGSRMRQFIAAFCRLPYHIIFTALEDHKEDRITGQQIVCPNFPGKLAMDCPAFFNLVFHGENAKDEEGKPTRVWRTTNDGRTLAKDSYGVLDDFEQPNWTNIFAKVLNGSNNSNGKH